MANMDEVSRSILAFGIVAAICTDCYRRRWRKRGTEHTASEHKLWIAVLDHVICWFRRQLVLLPIHFLSPC